MPPAIRAAPAKKAAGAPSQVGFTFRLQSFRPDSPCVMPGQLFCTREDEHLWMKHANEWIEALARRAQSVQQQATVTRLGKQVADIENRNCWMGCSSGVDALVAISQQAQALAESWGEPVTEIDPDWGWSFPIPWGIPNWLLDAKKAWKKATSTASIAPLIIIGLLLLNNRRKGSWI